MIDLDDQKLDEEIQKQRDRVNTLTSIKESTKESVIESVRESDMQLSDQSLHEEELVNEMGEYIIFAGSNPQSKPSSFILAGSGENLLPSDIEDAHVMLNENLEPNFKKLNYANKINILLKALIIERNKNHELQIKVEVLKKEYVQKVKIIANLQGEAEQLIDQVAQGEIQVDKKTEEVNYLFQKHMQDKLKIEQQQEKIKNYETLMQNNE